MKQTITERLAEKGLALPEVASPAANYVPYVISQSILYISGQLPLVNGSLQVAGKLGDDVDLDTGVKAAEICALNILGCANAALEGAMERITRVVKIQGFVASTPDFVDQHLVINGASNFLVEILGERGRHARAAVGMAALPMNAAVEVDCLIEIA
ncbi:MAG: hypothetical protein MnENMB40S_14090 [Rhizobiaceae bacterium MnEN-MB40S]|nr:MAG: hypothetical protein MnENMB40S_14090 [Rhizobiaceae bacterium MnEN-MB40S]